MYHFVAGCLVLLISIAVAAAPPPNDSFGSRIVIGGTNLVVTERMDEATAEDDDPHVEDWDNGWRGTKQSVWWSWSAPAKGTLTIDPSPSSLREKVVAVYRGTSLTSLTNLATGVGDEVLTINVAPGETYELGVLTDTLEEGEVRLALRFDWPPPHDDFAQRAILSGKTFSFSGTLRGATDDFGHPERHDLWCEWTAPVSGRYRIRTPPGIGVSAAKGTALTDLQWFTDRVPQVNAGERLFFQIFGSLLVSGELFALELDTTHIVLEPALVISPNTTTLKLVPDLDYPQPTNVVMLGTNLYASPWELTFRARADRRPVRVMASYEGYRYEEFSVTPQVRAANDHFANADEIPSPGGTNYFDALLVATLEPGEPKHYAEAKEADGSLWWRWRASVDGHLKVEAYGTGLAVYRGEAIESLVRIDPWPKQIHLYPVESGATYYPAVQSKSNFYQEYGLRVVFLPQIPNDHFQQAEALPTSGAVPGDLTGATSEAGEPGDVPTVWYEWTAPAAGQVTFELIYPKQILEGIYRPIAGIACFQGNSLGELVRLDPPFSSDNPLTLTVTAGSRLLIQILKETWFQDGDNFLLKTSFAATPTNDLFANRTIIGAIPATASYNSRWTLQSEPGESLLMPGSGYHHSAWWEWTPQSDALVSISAQRGYFFNLPYSSQPNALVRVFRGDAITNLQQLTVETNIHGEVVFNAVAGTNYKIAVFARGNTEIDFILSPRVPNNDFADAAILTNEAAQIHFGMLGATFEPGENTNVMVADLGTYPSLGNLWWRFEAPADGYLKNVFGVPSLLTGEAQDELATVPTYESRFEIRDAAFTWSPVAAGEAYYFDIRKIFGATLQPPKQLAHYISYDFGTFQVRGLTNGTTVGLGTVPIIALAEPHPIYDGVLHGPAALRLVRLDRWGSTPQVTVVTNFPFAGALTNLDVGNYSLYGIGVITNGETMRTPEILFSVGSTNDFFAQRQPFETNAYSSMAGASLEPGEEELFGNEVTRSVWFEWIAPASEKVRVNAYHHPFLAGVSVFSGSSIDSLVTITQGLGTVTFPAMAGTPYQIAVTSTQTNLAEQTDISVEVQRAPANDFFAQATPLPERLFHQMIHSDVRLLSTEPGEPEGSTLLGSAWWKWTPSDAGTLEITGFPQEWQIFRGLELTALAPVSFDTNAAKQLLEVEGGATYYFRVTHARPDSTAGGIRLNFTATYPNDHFANATEVAGDFESRLSSLFLSLEEGEPATVVGVAKGSIWWKWQPRISGFVDAVAPQGWALDLFTGTSLATLERVGPLFAPATFTADRPYTWEVEAARVYYVRAAHNGNAIGGGITFVQPDVWPIPNDDFADRLPVTGMRLDIRGTTAGSTMERDEPGGTGSLWWSWKAPADGAVRIWKSQEASLHTFRGNELGTLTNISFASSAFPVSAGEEIQIGVFRWLPGPFEWHLEFFEPAPNTDPNTAIEIPAAGMPVIADFTKTIAPRRDDGRLENSYLRWQWTAPVGGQVTIVSDEPNLDNARFFFEAEMRSTLDVVAGRTYSIFGYGNVAAEFTLALQPTPVTLDLEPQSPGETLRLNLSAPPETVIILESSANLFDWDAVETFHLQSPTAVAVPAAEPVRFFRAIPLN